MTSNSNSDPSKNSNQSQAQDSSANSKHNPTANSQSRTFLVMKLTATVLIIFVLGILYLQSNHQEKRVASQKRNFITDLSPVTARSQSPISEFSLFDFDSKTSGPINMASLTGQIVHFIFWASWCEPCRTELPAIEKLAKDLNSATDPKYRVVLINLDQDDDDREKAKGMQKLLIPSAWGVYEKTSELAEQMNVEAIPFHVVVDTQGRTASAFYASIDEKDKRDRFKDLLLQLLSEVK